MESHPDIVVEKKSDSPDSKLLIPTRKDLFSKHPLINPKIFLGDAAFDTVQLYKDLLSGDTFGENPHFSKAYIPLNARCHLENVDYTINENGIPCCPHVPSLPMNYEGTPKLRSGVTRYKFVCLKMQWFYDKSTKKAHRECLCENPCTSSKCERTLYLYPEKTVVLTPAPFVEPKNGIILINSGPSSKGTSIISKIISALLVTVPKTKIHYMPIYYLSLSHN